MAASEARDPFRSSRLIYRAVRPEDNSLFEAIIDDHIGWVNSCAGNITLPGPMQADKFRKKVSEQLLGAVICLSQEGSKRPGTPIGQISLQGLPPHLQHHRHAEIVLNILPEHQRCGYGGEAILWALDFAFRRAGLHKVKIRAFKWNQAAIRLYERLGFKHEGRDRESYWHEGRFWDGVEFGILDREWQDLPNTFELS